MTSRAHIKNKSDAPRKARQFVYPFTAIVGQEEMKLALLLNVIDPLIGGVLIMGHRGTGKSTAVRALADLLPLIWKARGCFYGCDPADLENLCVDCSEQLKLKGKLQREQSRVPVVDLPLGATEDRVCGTINFQKALTTGVKAFEPGLLARANRGFLYVDEVNLLEDHLVDLLLDVAVTGRNTVERESISLEHPARFVLVGSGNPEEGELRPQLLDRFGLFAEIRTVEDLDQRVKIVELREAFERDAEKFCADYEAEQQSLRRKLARAVKLAGKVKLSRELLRGIASLCLRLGIDGHRGELTIARAARALAAFEGRREARQEDVRRVAALCVRHRLRRDPLEPTGGGARIEQALDNSFQSSDEQRDTGQPASSNASNADERNAVNGNPGESAKHNQGNDKTHPLPAPLDAQLPEESLKQDFRSSIGQAKTNSARQQRNAKNETYNHQRGRYSRAIKTKSPDAKIALDATLRAAATNHYGTRQKNSNGKTSPTPYTLRPTPLRVDADSLRFKQLKRKSGTLFILGIDTSGSMAFNRIERARGALEWLLNKSYIRRDRVAIVAFRGQEAEELLPPSQSMSRARRVLDNLLMGGSTPLAAALATAQTIATRAARQGTEKIIFLLFTDGRPNVPLRAQHSLNPVQRQSAIISELKHLGSALRKAGVKIVLVDTQNRFTAGGEGRALVVELGGNYVYLSSSVEAEKLF
jgi:magnesium chelatase ATPase subunit I